MNMPTQPTPATQLDQAEQVAQERIDEVLAAATAAGVTGAALLALLSALTGAVQRAAQAGWGIGARIVLNGTLGRLTRGPNFTVEPLPTSVEQDVAAVVADAAERIDRIPEEPAASATSQGAAEDVEEQTAGASQQPSDAEQATATPGTAGQQAGPVSGSQRTRAGEWERTRRRLHTLAVVKIHQAASAATFSYASWLGLDLEWVTRRDGKACIICTTMNGKRVASGDKFADPRGPGIPRTLWRGFQGLPPAHPRCRCRCLPRT